MLNKSKIIKASLASLVLIVAIFFFLFPNACNQSKDGANLPANAVSQDTSAFVVIGKADSLTLGASSANNTGIDTAALLSNSMDSLNRDTLSQLPPIKINIKGGGSIFSNPDRSASQTAVLPEISAPQPSASSTFPADRKPIKQRKSASPKNSSEEPAFEGFNTIYFKPNSRKSEADPSVTRSEGQNRNSASADNIPAEISAVKVRNGNSVKVKLLADALVSGQTFPAGAYISAVVLFSGDRALLQFNTTILNGSVISVHCNAFSADDGLEGIPVPNVTSQRSSGTGVKSGIGNIINSATSTLSGAAGVAARSTINGVASGSLNSETPLSIPSSKLILKFSNY